MKTVHLDPDAVRPNSSRGKVVIVYGPNFDTGLNCDSSPNCGSVWPLGASIPGASERPADNLSSPPAVGLIRKEPHLTLTEAPAVSPPLSMDTLTRRQRDVLYLIVQGRTNKEIARSLGLCEGTVKIHVAALFGKLCVHRRAAVAIAGSRFLSPGALKSA